MDNKKTKTPWYLLARTPDLDASEFAVISFLLSLPNSYEPKRSWVEKSLSHRVKTTSFKKTWSRLKDRGLIKLKNNSNHLSGFIVSDAKLLELQDLDFKGGLKTTGVISNRVKNIQGTNPYRVKNDHTTPPKSNPHINDQYINEDNKTQRLSPQDNQTSLAGLLKNNKIEDATKNNDNTSPLEAKKQPALALEGESNTNTPDKTTKATGGTKKLKNKIQDLKPAAEQYLDLAEQWQNHMKQFKKTVPAEWHVNNIANELEKIGRLEGLNLVQQVYILKWIREGWWADKIQSIFSIRSKGGKEFSKIEQVVNKIKAEKKPAVEAAPQKTRRLMDRQQFQTQEEANEFFNNSKNYDKPINKGDYWEVAKWKMM